MCFILFGCVVRTYQVTKDRLDQDLTRGNRGYLKGRIPPSQELKERKTKRTTQVIEIELHPPIKFEKTPKTKILPETPKISKDQEITGNRGFIMESSIPEVTQPTSVNLEKYTVQKGDTLQKISQKFYGTTKKWIKIYEANKDRLKGPNKIYPGQIIDIPVEPLRETKENLK